MFVLDAKGYDHGQMAWCTQWHFTGDNHSPHKSLNSLSVKICMRKYLSHPSVASLHVFDVCFLKSKSETDLVFAFFGGGQMHA